MPQDQLSIFRKSVAKFPPRQVTPPAAPAADSTIMQTLPAYRAYLAQPYAEKTQRMYWGDIRELSVYLTGKTLAEITALDLQQWVGTLGSTAGRNLQRKTLNRKLSAVGNYFSWLQS